MSLTVEICSKLGEYRQGKKIRTFQHPDLNFKLVVFTSLFKFQVGCFHTNTLDETKKLSQATSLKLNINRNFQRFQQYKDVFNLALQYKYDVKEQLFERITSNLKNSGIIRVCQELVKVINSC